MTTGTFYPSKTEQGRIIQNIVQWLITLLTAISLLIGLTTIASADNTTSSKEPGIIPISLTGDHQPVQQAVLQGNIEYNRNAYLIGAGDVLSVSVYNQPDLAQSNILVRADGMATFPGMGEISVDGKSIGQIQTMLEYELGNLVREPIVSVTVNQTKPGTIYLSGAVMHPGMFQLSTGNQNSSNGPSNTGPISRIDLKISNVIANSGGVKMNADLSKVSIKRKITDGSTVEITVNLWKMLRDGDGSQDLMLHSGDALFIPELPQQAMSDQDYNLLVNSSLAPGSFPVRVLGELEKPGIYQITGDSPYLQSAIAQAGGYTDGALQKEIAIRRFTTDTQYTTLFVNPKQQEIVLHPNDVIVVSEKKLYKTGKFFDQIAKILSPFTNTAWSAAALF